MLIRGNGTKDAFGGCGEASFAELKFILLRKDSLWYCFNGLWGKSLPVELFWGVWFRCFSGEGFLDFSPTLPKLTKSVGKNLLSITKCRAHRTSPIGSWA